MLGELTTNEIEDLLRQQVTGRIACYADGRIYIVPINYAYNGVYLFGHSTRGKKIDMMRKNPEVCFEVDDIQSIFHWKSVIAWGRFEEITDMDEKQQAMQAIIHRIMPLAENAPDHPSHGITEKESDVGSKVELIVYKIALAEKTGRYEY
ncbi:pyridoxamine 5'-phosphate oxidase family protein [Mucilaginibacter sp. HC2]|nr:pyridoxamine 5'-phosphate oxidase family protein [Mucilaginibacter inviolabilis]